MAAYPVQPLRREAKEEIGQVRAAGEDTSQAPVSAAHPPPLRRRQVPNRLRSLVAELIPVGYLPCRSPPVCSPWSVDGVYHSAQSTKATVPAIGMGVRGLPTGGSTRLSARRIRPTPLAWRQCPQRLRTYFANSSAATASGELLHGPEHVPPRQQRPLGFLTSRRQVPALTTAWNAPRRQTWPPWPRSPTGSRWCARRISAATDCPGLLQHGQGSSAT